MILFMGGSRTGRGSDGEEVCPPPLYREFLSLLNHLSKSIENRHRNTTPIPPLPEKKINSREFI